MSVSECISKMISASGNLFETNQKKVVESILCAKKTVFLDTCFITKSLHLKTEDLLKAYETLAGGKKASDIVFVVTELVLYELKDSAEDKLQKRNEAFFCAMSEYGFQLLLLKEETMCENIRPYMSHTVQHWNQRFCELMHENIANMTLGKRLRTDSRIPHFGFCEYGFCATGDGTFVKEIIAFLKEMKADKDSMAEELIVISMFFLFELIRGTHRNELLFCSHDFGALARMNQFLQTSYPDMRGSCKRIHVFSMVQYMVAEGILDSKEEVLAALKNIMNDTVTLVIRNNLPFQSDERKISISEAVDMLFENQTVELICYEKK